MPIAGFESTDYAYCGDQIVWIGDNGAVRHPRNYWSQWHAPDKAYSPALLKVGARRCLKHLAQNDTHGLLLWLTHRELPFPLNHAAPRFDAIAQALQSHDAVAFETAALRVLGLGHGLTPSGDDFLGGIWFVHALLTDSNWLSSQKGLKTRMEIAASTLTNPISAALLSDNMQGASHGELHDMLDAMESNDSRFIAAATASLLSLGSSSGADMLAGLLLALTLL